MQMLIGFKLSSAVCPEALTEFFRLILKMALSFNEVSL